MSTQRTRKPAVRAFASEIEDAQHQYKEDPDDDRSANFALLPTGREVNRVFVVGTLTEKEDVGNDNEYWHARVVDPTGTYHVYAGQYQPDAATLIRETETPEYVALTAKVTRYELDDGGYNVTLRPENMTVTDQATRDRWLIQTAEATLDRIKEIAATDPPGDREPENARERALAHYEPNLEDYRMDVRDALNTI